MSVVKCGKCGEVYDTGRHKKCPGCGKIPKIRKRGATPRMATTTEGTADGGMVAPSWWNSELAEKRSVQYIHVIKVPSMRLSERQILVDLQYQCIGVAKKSFGKCPQCGTNMKREGAASACINCGTKAEHKDLLTDAYLNASMSLRPLISSGVITEDAAVGILTHVAVYLGLFPEFKDLPENWSCPVCGMPKKKFRVLGKKRFGLF